MRWTTTRLVRRGGTAAGAAAVLTTVALLAAGIARADVINASIDSSDTPIILTAGDPASTGSATVKVVENKNDGDNGCNIDDDEKLTIELVTPAGVVATPATLTFTSCQTLPVSFAAQANAVSGTVTAKITENTTGDGSFQNVVGIPIVVTAPPPVADGDNDNVPDSTDNCPTVANPTQANADGDTLGNACDDNSYPPVAANAPSDENGTEGSGLSAAGSFTDADGNNTLTISQVSGAGSITDNGDGTWSWQHSTNDDATGTVQVRASDGEHETASQTFAWTADNVAPVVGSVSTTRTGACAVTVSAAFTDAGSADTHTAAINWGDGIIDSSAATAVAGSHTYPANGSYQIGITVTDDDQGADTAAAAFATKNTPGTLMQPINAAGTRSVFKLGSTIPVKVQVTGCDGAPVTTLSPAVALTKLDSQPDGSINEASLDTVPTNGLAMRWAEPQYIYNLSTKLSQQTGAALVAGTYRITVSDPSFLAPVVAQVDLRK
ncbi:PxKF domain-containing protein [Kribbella deserti]|uniref:PxKF domain-containing protein n=1 Tax=Kribbella deserti TaxID=1926257 RepID=A0ABV6QWG1_9ACTN